ncbi:unnamed protein product, partial [Aureobasidium pullulans]
MDMNKAPLGPASPDGVDWTQDIPDSDHVRFSGQPRFITRNWVLSSLGAPHSACTLINSSRITALDVSIGAFILTTEDVRISNKPQRGPEKSPSIMRLSLNLLGFAPISDGPHICRGIPRDLQRHNARCPRCGDSSHGQEKQLPGGDFFTGNFNPLRGDDGRVEGFYNSLTEVTRQKITDRRRKMLNLIAALPDGCTSDTLGSHFMNCFQTNSSDMPFVVMWSTDGDTSLSTKSATRLKFMGSIGLPEGHKLRAERASLDSEEETYSLLRNAAIDPVTCPRGPDFDDIQWQGFEEPSQHICTVPISNAGRLYGYLMVGANPRRPIDDDHEQFMRDLATQTSSTMAFLVSMEESRKRQNSLENQLAASERHIRYMADHLDVGLEHLNLDGKVIWANEHYFSLIGQEPTTDFQTLRLPFKSHVLEEDQPKILAAWEAVVKVSYEKLWTPPSGPPINATVLLSAIPYVEDGEIKSVVACMTEVSRLKWAEAWQARAAYEAQEAKRQQSEFTDAISHEVRNPLSAMLQLANGISGCLEDITEEDASPEECLQIIQDNIEAAKTIIFCANHQKKIVDDVLILSKMDFMLLTLSPSPSRPLDLAQNAVKMLHATISEAKIDLKVEEDESITRLGLSWVLCDPLRVAQILINLLSNAIKFTRQESRRCVTVCYGASIEEPSNSFGEGFAWASSKHEQEDVTNGQEWGDGEQVYLTFCVKDTGPGMTEEERSRLFSRFQQASPKTSIKYGGTGLGLFISHTLTEKQNGKMGVISKPGKEVPLPSSSKVVGCQAHLHPLQSLRKSSSRKRDSGCDCLRETQKVQRPKILSSPKIPQYLDPSDVVYHILLVEDNIINQRIMRAQLVKAKCNVYVANHGLEALDNLRRSDIWQETNGTGHKLDVILMDVEMPIMDGLSACREIRSLEKAGKLTRHIEVIAITANVRQAQVDRALDAGIDEVMSKPFVVPELLTMIKSRLGR